MKPLVRAVLLVALCAVMWSGPAYPIPLRVGASAPSTPGALSGVTALSTVSCPSAAVCYAGGGSGIMKSSDGGTAVSYTHLTLPTNREV